MGLLTQISLALWLALGAQAAPAPQTAEAPRAAQASGALEQQAKRIETMIIAPCCWSQQVSLHQSPASDEIKASIRKLLAEGKTQQEILDAAVAQYGDRVLAEPPARGFSGLLYVLPWVFLAGSVGLVFVVIRRLRTPGLQPAAAGRAPSPLDDAVDERIDDELRRLD